MTISITKKILFICLFFSLALAPAISNAGIFSGITNIFNPIKEAINTAKNSRIDAIKSFIKDISLIRSGFNSEKEAVVRKAGDNQEQSLQALRELFSSQLQPILDRHRLAVNAANDALKNKASSIADPEEFQDATQSVDKNKKLVIAEIKPKNMRVTEVVSGMTIVMDMIIPSGYFDNSTMQKDPFAHMKARTEIYLSGSDSVYGEMIMINKKGYTIFGNIPCTVMDYDSAGLTSQMKDSFESMQNQLNSGTANPKTLIDWYNAGKLEYTGEKHCNSGTCEVWKMTPLGAKELVNTTAKSYSYYVDTKSHLVTQMEIVLATGSIFAQLEYDVKMDEIKAPTGKCTDMSSFFNSLKNIVPVK